MSLCISGCGVILSTRTPLAVVVSPGCRAALNRLCTTDYDILCAVAIDDAGKKGRTCSSVLDQDRCVTIKAGKLTLFTLCTHQR